MTSEIFRIVACAAPHTYVESTSDSDLGGFYCPLYIDIYICSYNNTMKTFINQQLNGLHRYIHVCVAYRKDYCDLKKKKIKDKMHDTTFFSFY